MSLTDYVNRHPVLTFGIGGLTLITALTLGSIKIMDYSSKKAERGQQEYIQKVAYILEQHAQEKKAEAIQELVQGGIRVPKEVLVIPQDRVAEILSTLYNIHDPNQPQFIGFNPKDIDKIVAGRDIDSYWAWINRASLPASGDPYQNWVARLAVHFGSRANYDNDGLKNPEEKRLLKSMWSLLSQIMERNHGIIINMRPSNEAVPYAQYTGQIIDRNNKSFREIQSQFPELADYKGHKFHGTEAEQKLSIRWNEFLAKLHEKEIAIDMRPLVRADLKPFYKTNGSAVPIEKLYEATEKYMHFITHEDVF